MKKILLVFIGLGLLLTSFGQWENKKRPSFGIHYLLNDFGTAEKLRANGLSKVLGTKDWHQTSGMTSGIAISYLQGMSKNLDFVGSIAGSFLDYPIQGKPLRNDPSLLLEGVASANLKLLPDKFCLVPFLTAGVGASKYRGYFAAFVPVGMGLQVKLLDEVFLMLNTQYRVPITENASYHLYHSLGIVAPLTKKVEPPKPVEIPVVEPPKDRDGDGVLDDDDKCPDVKGLASLQGCPDRDGDGITDAEDDCPDVPGLARYKGCPIPDTDKDGINDEEDKCPTVPGIARYQGCPIPDTDGDGVNDEEDKCINEKGPASNFGCPVISEDIIKRINYAAKNVFFATNSTKLVGQSTKRLDDVVTILNENPSFKVQIDGHTDSQGKDEANQTLSEGRAASVKAYLESKGVDAGRLSSAG
ncbi:MAG: OmpA family protein, partial [Ferruginibacter sp.]